MTCLLFSGTILREGYQISAEFICAGNPKLPTATARIEGVANIDSSDPEEKRLKKAVTDGLDVPMLFGISILLSIVFNYVSKSQIKVPAILAQGFVVFVLLGVLAVLVIIVVFVWIKTIRPVVRLMQYRRKRKQLK